MLAATDCGKREAEPATVLRDVGDAVGASPGVASRSAPSTPSRRTTPLSAGCTPNSASAISVRPEPTSPAKPSTSPSRTSNETSSKAPARPSPSTLRATSPGSCGTRRKKSESSRPTMSRISVDLGDLAGRPGRDVLAVAEDGDPVAQLEHLVEAVADEQDRHARRGQASHLAEQALHLERREGGGRLVHDQHADVARHRLGDLHGLLAGDGELRGERTRVDVDLEPARISAARCCIARQCTRRPPGLAHEDVLGDGQVGEDERFLVDAGDAERLRRGRVAQLDRPRPPPRGARSPGGTARSSP